MTKEDLTSVQRYVLLTLMIKAAPRPNKDFSNSLKADKREELVKLGYLETTRESGRITLELTQKGHDRALAELSAEPPERSGIGGLALYAILEFLRELIEHTGTSPRDLFRLRLAKPVAPAAGHGDLEERIRKAYAELAPQPGDYIMLARLRESLPDVARRDLDATLIKLNRSPGVNLVPESNQKVLTDTERAGAVDIGNQLKHLLAIKA